MLKWLPRVESEHTSVWSQSLGYLFSTSVSLLHFFFFKPVTMLHQIRYFSRENTQSYEMHRLPSYLRWFISASLAAFFPGPQLCLRKGERERMEFLRKEQFAGTSVMLSISSSSISPGPTGSLSLSRRSGSTPWLRKPSQR